MLNLASYKILPEPRIIFNGLRNEIHPLKGLRDYGPYSLSLNYPSEVKPAFITPKGELRKIENLFSELNNSHNVVYGKDFFIPYTGFESIFRIPMISPTSDLKIELPSSCDNHAKLPDGISLATEIINSVLNLWRYKTQYNIIVIYLPNAWSKSFIYSGFNLRDYLKAKLAISRIPIQIINDEALNYACRSSVMWGISIALYAKAGGIPWKLEDMDKDEAYIGISYAIKKNENDAINYVTCCSQVFDPDGTGFEFLAYDAKEYTTDNRGNPFLSYEEMHAVLSKSLHIYQENHDGHIPKKVYVHKNSLFKEEEIKGAFSVFGSKTEVELIQIIRRANWWGLKVNHDKVPGFPLERGTYFPLTENECLLWTQGNVSNVNVQNPRYSFFKEGLLKPIPEPILIRRFSGDGGWHNTCSSIYNLTKMDWNNCTLYKTLPVTLWYSQVFADAVKHAPDISNDVYDYRFFM